jgi:hypothetical protein
MKKKISNKCGGKNSGCAVQFDLPKLETPIRVSDNVKSK